MYMYMSCVCVREQGFVFPSSMRGMYIVYRCLTPLGDLAHGRPFLWPVDKKHLPKTPLIFSPKASLCPELFNRSEAPTFRCLLSAMVFVQEFMTRPLAGVRTHNQMVTSRSLNPKAKILKPKTQNPGP